MVIDWSTLIRKGKLLLVVKFSKVYKDILQHLLAASSSSLWTLHNKSLHVGYNNKRDYSATHV